MNKSLNRLIILALTLLIFGVTPVMAANDSDWNRSIAFYFWLGDTEVDAIQDGASVGGGTIEVEDLVDKTEFGYAILGEIGPAERPWSVFADLAYFELADDVGLDGLDIKIDVEATILDLAGVYSPASTGGNFGLYAGIRYLSIGTEIGLTLPDGNNANIDVDDDYTDALIGARIRTDLSDQWSLKIRGDTSTGDTEHTFQAECLFGYRIGKTKNKQLLFGYRYRETEIEEEGLTQEIVTAGPIAAFRIDF
jgi:hypothetical protein